MAPGISEVSDESRRISDETAKAIAERASASVQSVYKRLAGAALRPKLAKRVDDAIVEVLGRPA
jgi:hypothetical protein